VVQAGRPPQIIIKEVAEARVAVMAQQMGGLLMASKAVFMVVGLVGRALHAVLLLEEMALSALFGRGQHGNSLLHARGINDASFYSN
jgi:hypothetical protein